MAVILGWYFPWRPIPLRQVQIGLGSIWNPKKDWEVLPHEPWLLYFSVHIIERQGSSSSRWSVGSGRRCACSQALVAGVSASPKSLPPAAIWVRLPDLPSSLWSRSTLDLIVAKVGPLLRLNESTELLTKRRYAWVVVEVDLTKPLLLELRFPVEDQWSLHFGNISNSKIFTLCATIVGV